MGDEGEPIEEGGTPATLDVEIVDEVDTGGRGSRRRLVKIEWGLGFSPSKSNSSEAETNLGLGFGRKTTTTRRKEEGVSGE